ncbi:MAG TPA: DUF1003 domain-containing protein [Fimbriimonadaceae bacterium]|jgi:uncharacterized membrane protein
MLEKKPPDPNEFVEQNIQAILDLQNNEEFAWTRHHRLVEKIVNFISVPAFLFAIFAAVLVWIGVNSGLVLSGKSAPDPPPFAWLQIVVSVAALVMTSAVLITQRRQGKLSDRNAHLDLQVNLLVEQKTAKIIALLEEMRVDSPHLRNRVDSEAEALKVSVDPAIVATAISEKLTEPVPEEDVPEVG